MSNQQEPTESDNKEQLPILKKEYELLILWDSIPAMIKLASPDARKLLELDPAIEELCSVRFDKDFAEKYGFERSAIYEWRRLEDYRTRLKETIEERWAKRFKKEIDYAFTQATIKEADAPRMKLWKQLFEGWREAQELEIVDRAKLSEIEKATKKISEQIAKREQTVS